jgi:uncharacterized damage-inducible protein DinB
MSSRPDRGEAAAYYFTYIDKVPEGDIRTILADQASDVATALNDISEERSLHRYAADKWTLREVVNHCSDTERLFVARAFWFARGFDSPLPSFDQNIAIAAANANAIAWKRHIEEFRAVRAATVSFFGNLPEEAWTRRGIASDNPFTVRALAYLAAGHVAHHMAIVRERYLDR